MKLAEFKRIIDAAHEYAGESSEHVEIFVGYKGKEYDITEVKQFGVVADTYIYIGEKVWDEDEFNEKFLV